MLLFIKFSSGNKSVLWLTEAKEHEFIGNILEGYWEAHKGQGKAEDLEGLEKHGARTKVQVGALSPCRTRVARNSAPEFLVCHFTLD